MGEFYALAAAVVWALAVILFRKSGEVIAPFALNLFRVGISSLCFGLIMLASGAPLGGQAAGRDVLMLVLSGIIGIALSDTLFHRALNTVGAGIIAIVDCLYAPLVVLIAFLLLGERLGPWQLAGMAVVIGGVLSASRHRPVPGLSTRQLSRGVIWGVLAMVTVALGIVIAKPVLERTPVLWATFVRQIGALAVMVPVALGSSARRRIWSVFAPARSWRYSLTGTLLGSCLALLLWIAGMKFTEAGAAAILNQTSSIYVLIFASLFLHEPFTRRKLLAATLSLTGIVMVTLG